MESFTHLEIQNFSTQELKSIIKNGLADIETEDIIFKELFEIRRIEEFLSLLIAILSDGYMKGLSFQFVHFISNLLWNQTTLITRKLTKI